MENEAQQIEKPVSVEAQIKGILGAIDESDQGDDVPEATEDGSGDGGGSGAVDAAELQTAETVEDDLEDGEAADSAGDDERSDIELLAERLEIDQADVYELEVPLKDGGSVSLSELKDAYQEYGPVKEARAENARQKQEHERQLLQTRTELNAIMSVIPENMRAEIIRQAQERNQSWERSQEQAVLETIPEWADPDARSAARKQIVEALSDYAFSEAEIEHTQDARTLRFIKDAVGWKAELDAMKAAAKRERIKGQKKSRPAPTQSKQKALRAAIAKVKADPNPQSREQAVTQILRQ